MNAQRLQQVRTDVRRSIGRHALTLGFGLSLLIVALAAQRYAAPYAGFVPEARRPNPAPIANQSWPGATLTGSAYNGQSARPIVVAAASSSWPGATLTGSAYNGQPAHTTLVTARPVAQSWPGATLTGSAYDGQPARPIVVAAPSSSWPGATLMGSAYNGQ
jgi:hypothetical protein